MIKIYFFSFKICYQDLNKTNCDHKNIKLHLQEKNC